MAFSKEEERILSRYVSNTDKDIYSIFNLPEEVIAVIFAYVSRSPKSFRENLLSLIQGKEVEVKDLMTVFSDEGITLETAKDKAKRFHEKWVVGYGHSSVAEHACIHLGVEKISRLASAELELAVRFLSFTEYSQRYQRPVRGDFFIPDSLNSGMKNKFIEFNNFTYDQYALLNEKLVSYLKSKLDKDKDESDRAFDSRVEKIAFEDARYVLPLSVFTNLGMTGNARAIEEALIKLLSSPVKEVRKMAEAIKQEGTAVVPVLIKYANENEYLKAASDKISSMKKSSQCTECDSSCTLMDYTGRGEKDPEDYALSIILKALSVDENDDDRKEAYSKIVEKIGKHDYPADVLRHITYNVKFNVSEACWHQLLRHNREICFSYQDPTVENRYIIPPNIRDAGLSDVVKKVIEKSNAFYDELMKEAPELAVYVVTNAHKRRIFGTFSLWELYHFINIRMSEHAQWEIQDLSKELLDQIRKHHPFFVEKIEERK